MPQTSPSVLVIRLDAIGDALALTPLLAALRERSIPVELVLRRVNAGIFSSRAARAVHVASFALRSSARENRRAIDEFAQRLSANPFTHILVATEDPSGYRLAHRIGAPVRVGFINGWGKPFKSLWARTLVNHVVVRSAGLDPAGPHESVVLFNLARSILGDDATPTHDSARLRSLIVEREPPRSSRIAFQVTDKWQRLGMSLKDVVTALQRTANAGEVHAIASENEADYARTVASESGMTVDRFSSLEPWKEAIAGARAIVAPDSGALHVAGMVGTPTVAVFPPIKDYALQTARWSPWAAPYRVIRADDGWPAQISRALRQLL